MAEILSYDATPTAEVMSSIESDEADSLAIGEELMAQHEGMLAGKYKNAQDLEKAYMELEKKLGGNNREESVEEDTYEEEPAEEESRDYSDLAELFSLAGDEYSEKGELSAETLEAFSQMSSQDLVQAYLEMQANQPSVQGRELSNQEVNQLQNSVGGQAAYNQLTSWAAENFSESEIEAFDSLVESGNTNAIQLALQALYYRYTDAMGVEGELLSGKPARSQDAFRSQAELVRAMSDPRYDNDPAYRQDVIEKLERSDVEF
ncbi:MAG: capsid assembly protein [Candidatus Nanopelagicaceae bacterium]